VTEAGAQVRPDLGALAERGIGACRRGEWRQGVTTLQFVVTSSGSSDQVPGLAYSYLGYGRAYLDARYREGLELCRVGIRKDFYVAENYLNLARTCLLLDRRKMAVEALDRGLQVDPKDKALLALRKALGVRRRPPVPFLGRTHPLNRAIGQIRSGLTRRA
jgi:tetratricopeptide (TPR) repeat protein